MTEPVWHLARQGQQFGPYTWPQIQLMAREGHIQPGDLLWGPSLPQWTPAGRIQGLALPPPAAPAPPRPAAGAPAPPPAAPAYPPSAPPPAPAAPQTPTPPPAAPAPAPPAAGFAPSPAAPKRSGRSCLVIGIVLLALAILAGGVAALIWWAPWQAAPAGADEPEAALFSVHEPASTKTNLESSGSVTLSDARNTIRLSDDSSIAFPGLATGTSLSASFERRSNDYPLNVPGLQPTGPMRVLTLGDTRPLADPRLAPVITIPAADAGRVAPETVQLARLHAGRLVFLPLHRTPAGRFVARDIAWLLAAAGGDQVGKSGQLSLTPDPRPGSWLAPPARPGYLALGLFSPLATVSADSRTAGANVIQYFPVTYQQHINWQRQPQLVRMTPSYRVPERRLPFSKLSPWDQGQELKKPVHNVFVLVHGRNEMEKAGIDTPPQIGAPWFYSYKRDVWTHLYDVHLKDHKQRENTTVFFEFIYPSFRPIFQGDGPAAEFFHRLIREKLKKQLDLKYPFNLFIIAHSQGGVVSRAGVQHFDGDLDADFQRLATWGTPHLGSPLVTLNYALISPCYKLAETVVSLDIHTGEVKTVKLGADWRKYLFDRVLVTDTPGTMDLRWTLGAADYPSELALEELKFEYERAYIEKTFGSMNQAAPVVSLRHGSYLYNQNLRLLNERDKYAGTDRYVFLYGVTNKGVRVNLAADWGDLYRQVSALIRQKEIGFGATANWALVKGPEKEYRSVPQGSADGAVPVLSMSGHNLAGKVVPLGDCDHEEYFGAPDAPGHFPLRDKALVTARRTLQELGLGSVKKYDPPTIQLRLDRESDLDEILRGEGPRWLAVRGRLEWPGDPNAARRIDPKQVEASAQRRGGKSREPVGARNLTLRANGEFEAELYVGDIREAGLAAKGQVDTWVRLFFKDGTALDSEPLVLAGRPALLGYYIGTIKTTTINRDYILKRHMLPGSGEYIEMMNRIATRKNEIFLSNLEFSKATENHKLAMGILSNAENSGEAEVLEGKYFLEFIYHGAGVVPNGFRPYKDKRNGAITQSYGDREFQVTRVTTENDNNQTYTYHIVVKGRLDGDTLSGTWSITENGVQILAGTYTARRMGSDN